MAATTPPLSLGEILDRTVQLYRRNFLLLLGISFLPAAVDVLVSGGAGIYISSHSAQIQTAANPQVFLAFFGIIAAFLFLGLPLLLAIFSLALNALNYAATQRSHGMPVNIGEAYAYAYRQFWRYLGIFSMQLAFSAAIPCAVFAGIVFIGVMLAALAASSGSAGSQAYAVLIGLGIFVLALGLIVAMILIWLRFCLAFPACATEGIKAWPAMQRSNQLTKGTRGRIFVMYLLVFVLTLVAYYALDLPIQIILKLTVFKSMEIVALLSHPPVLLQVVNLFISFLERSFVMPIYAIALVLFYNDQRTRQEGYDIELLMAQAGFYNLPPAATTEQPAAAETAFAPAVSMDAAAEGIPVAPAEPASSETAPPGGHFPPTPPEATGA